MVAGPFRFALQIGDGPITGADRANQSAAGSCRLTLSNRLQVPKQGIHEDLFSHPRTVQRHNPSNCIRQVFSAWRDVGGFADGDRDRERSPPAITMAQ